MAHRDRSAGHAFMYVNVKELLEQTQEIKKAAETASPVQTIPHATHHVSQPQASSSSGTAGQVQGNLERLQALHHKLHAMLEELNKFTGKK